MNWWVESTKRFVQHFLILTFTITVCISIFAFASLLGMAIGITSSAVRLKDCVTAAGIKKYKSTIKKK